MDGISALLNAQLQSLMGEVNQREGISVERLADALDDQIASENRSITAQTLTGYSQRLLDTVRALEKIKEGSYGLCDECDEPIKENRLKAVIEAIRCLKCQDKHDLQRRQLDERQSKCSRPSKIS